MPPIRPAAAALAILILAAAPASAQRRVTFGAAAGYLAAGGGDPAWRDDARGPALGVAAGLRLGDHTALVAEGGYQHFGSLRSSFACDETQCVNPQTFVTVERRSGITVDLLFRVHSAAGRVRPYGVAGLGHPTMRPRARTIGTAPDGTVVTDDSYGSDSQAVGVVFGGGVEVGPPSAGIAFTAGVRARAAVSGYDGGPTLVRMGALMIGVVLR